MQLVSDNRCTREKTIDAVIGHNVAYVIYIHICRGPETEVVHSLTEDIDKLPACKVK